MQYDCDTRTVAGTTLVAVRVRNDAAVPRRIRLTNELPGPVLPPRREGVPERGWDETGFTGVVEPGRERALGYACPVVAGAESFDADAESDDVDGESAAAESPVSVESLGRADGGERADPEAEAIRALGRARPPADAVPTRGDSDSTPTHGDAIRTAAGKSTDADGSPAEPPRSSGGAAFVGDGATADEAESPHVDADERIGGDETADLPAPVESWLAGVETRVARAERLTDATAADAAAVLEDAPRPDALPASVAADEAALRALAARADELAARAAASDAEPVVDALVER